MKNILIIGLLLIASITLVACEDTRTVLTPPTNDPVVNLKDNSVLMFASVDEMKEYLSKSESQGTYNTGSIMRGGIAMDAAVKESVSAPTTSGSADYSQTNVQVQGVDEADFIKNDDKYIYLISNNQLVIIEANGENSKTVSQTKFSDNTYGYMQPAVRDLYLVDDKLILFVDKYDKSFYIQQYNIEPVESYIQNTVVYIYNITDRTNPVISEEFTISGYYFSSRMIDDDVYVVTQDNLNDWTYYDGPMIAYAKTVIRPSIYYFDNPETNYNMNTVTSINVDSEEVIDSESFMLGYGNTIMVSEDNIYIAYQKYVPWCWGWRCTSSSLDNSRDRFLEAVVPNLEGELKKDIDNILSERLSTEDEWNKISEVFVEFYKEVYDDKTLKEEYEDMFINIEDSLNEYDSKKALDNSKTIIHRISIDDGEINYESNGVVVGTLLNQFSMDEYDGNLRVATNINLWMNRGNARYNNVYVLNDNLETIGSIKNIAENESIYSTRFVGDKLYMVTFRQIDPFFVIDLSSPTNPKVLGYLKIPGYSSYLHPINDNLILGVGMNTGENQWGGTSTKGVKIALFDVSDFSNPKELDNYEIGMEGSNTPVSYDHKAFLYSESKNIIVIPVNEVVDKVKSGEYNYRYKTMSGAYVLSIEDDELVRKGVIEHSRTETIYYGYDQASVTRSLYIEDTLYTISNKYVIASDLENDLDELVTIDLPKIEAYNGPEPYYGSVVANAPVKVME